MIIKSTFDKDNSRFIKWTEYKSTLVRTIPMGFEYEIERTSQYAKPKLPDGFVVQWEGLHWDNGLQICGYEIKSPIAPLHYHKYLLRRYFKDIKWCYDPENHGGIHVNVSTSIRRGRERRDKIADFALKYRDEMQQISGRSEYSFNKYANVELEAPNYYSFISTRKTHAFELRMFHAQPHLLLPALEFTDSMFELADHEAGGITMDSWLRYINRWPRYRSISQHVRHRLCKQSSLSSVSTMMAPTSLVSIAA